MRNMTLTNVIVLGLLGAIVGGATGSVIVEIIRVLMFSPNQVLNIGISASAGGIFGGAIGIVSMLIVVISTISGSVQDHGSAIALWASRLCLLFGNVLALAVLWDGRSSVFSGNGNELLGAAASIVFISACTATAQYMLSRLALPR